MKKIVIAFVMLIASTALIGMDQDSADFKKNIQNLSKAEQTKLLKKTYRQVSQESKEIIKRMVAEKLEKKKKQENQILSIEFVPMNYGPEE